MKHQTNHVIPLTNYKDYSEVKSLQEYAKVHYNSQRDAYFVKLIWQGKRYYFSKFRGISVSKYPKLAENLATCINNDIDSGVFQPNQYKQKTPLRLSQYYEKWIESVKPSLSSATLFDYKNSFKNHILPVLSDRFLENINRADLKLLMNSIKRSPKGKYNVINALKKLLNDALDSSLIKQVPSFKGLFTGKNKVIEPEINWIEQNEQWEIVAEIPVEDRGIFSFIMLTGCRPSEARAFRKKDIYWNEHYIKFAVTFGKLGELKETKGKKVKAFPLTDSLVELFRTLKPPKKILQEETIYQFINPRTGKHYDKSFNRVWNKACKKAEIYIKLNHAGRHSFATQMLNENIPEGLVSELLRHSDPRMIKKYGTYKTEALKKAVDKVKQFPTNKQQTPKIRQPKLF